ncbi:MAG: ABC transporter permease [Actinophytocola sp.]|uniref:ABC transporter permease n=1 Tax=Actinophytocola sp. TaxID=1872138 RepID=UPI001326660A|nr:ABC transporter permease [Actinophytocola sp.]MPZ83954.1 ABC transporter permease [Actinophytocola sp.]
MNGQNIAVGWPLACVLLLLACAGALVVWLGRIDGWRPTATAAVRAVVQLAAVSLLITAVLASGWLTAGFVLLMYGIAAVTSAGRIAKAGALGRLRTVPVPALSIAAGVAPVLALLLGTRVVQAQPVVIIPIAGIFIGGAMMATSLAGRRAYDELRTRRGEYEAALALGLLPRDAALLISRPTADQALVPVLDQTRTVGLVTLPGAFVGVLLGGGDPIQAGVTQLVVLISLLAIEAAAVLVTVELVARRA